MLTMFAQSVYKLFMENIHQTETVKAVKQPSHKLTASAYGDWQKAYDHFNKSLFNGTLPQCLITLQRKDKRSKAYYSSNRFTRNENGVDEIALNPQYFLTQDVRQTVSTLVHEMCHLWQHHHGKPSKAHHNKEWAQVMKDLGLHPSHTGEPGGKETGQKMTHYVIDGGLFDEKFKTLLSTRGFSLDYGEREFSNAKKVNRSNRTKYICEDCSAQVWGKPNLNIQCGDCDAPYLVCN